MIRHNYEFIQTDTGNVHWQIMPCMFDDDTVFIQISRVGILICFMRFRRRRRGGSRTRPYGGDGTIPQRTPRYWMNARRHEIPARPRIIIPAQPQRMPVVSVFHIVIRRERPGAEKISGHAQLIKRGWRKFLSEDWSSIIFVSAVSTPTRCPQRASYTRLNGGSAYTDGRRNDRDCR